MAKRPGRPGWPTSATCAQARSLTGRAAQQRHALELALARLSGRRALTKPTAAERRICAFAEAAVRLADSLPEAPRARLRDQLVAGLTGEATLIPLFHLIRTAGLLRDAGFAIRFTGLAEGTPHDLLVEREGASAEVVCETVSAEEGRPVHRGDWYALVDGIDPVLQGWLAAHPGRYLLKMTLPEGISGPDQLVRLQQQISEMLAAEKRQDSQAQAVLKLDPLMLAGAQAADQASGLPAALRAQFGPEAHLAVTTDAGSGSVLVMAARAGRENEVAAAVARRLGQVAESRLSGDPAGHRRGLPRGPRPHRMARAARPDGPGGGGAPLPDHRPGPPGGGGHLRLPLRDVRGAAAGCGAGGGSAFPQPGASRGQGGGAGAGDPVLPVAGARPRGL